MRVIRASDLGSYLYCRRAWWYQQQGIVSENQAELENGSQFHRKHGRGVLYARLMQGVGWLLLLAALILAAVGLTIWLLG